jgi:hypothetical protein
MQQRFVRWFTNAIDHARVFINYKNVLGSECALVHTTGAHGEQQWFWLHDGTEISAGAR